MKHKTINDGLVASIIADCIKRDHRALERLYKLVAPMLNHYAMGIVHNEALSNEILQDSFIQIWESANSFDSNKGKPLTWMRTIVRNKAIDKLRTETKHYRFRNTEQSDLLEELPANMMSQPEVVMSNTQLSQLIDAHIAPLPCDQRDSIMLAYFYGYSRIELASSMNTNINTIKSWLRRGLKSMKNQTVLNHL